MKKRKGCQLVDMILKPAHHLRSAALESRADASSFIVATAQVFHMQMSVGPRTVHACQIGTTRRPLRPFRPRLWLADFLASLALVYWAFFGRPVGNFQLSRVDFGLRMNPKMNGDGSAPTSKLSMMYPHAIALCIDENIAR